MTLRNKTTGQRSFTMPKEHFGKAAARGARVAYLADREGGHFVAPGPFVAVTIKPRRKAVSK